MISSARLLSLPLGQRAKPGSDKFDGLRFEQEVGDFLPQPYRRGVWFGYRRGDGSSERKCQIDFLLPYSNHLLLIECKRTWHRGVKQQIALYRQVVEKATGKRTTAVIAVKYRPTERVDRLFTEYGDAVKEAGRFGWAVWCPDFEESGYREVIARFPKIIAALADN